MSDATSQSAPPSRGGRPAAAWAPLLATLLVWVGAGAARAELSGAPPVDAEAVGLDTAIGRVEYRAGRGLHLGDTRLTIGGFTTAEAERLEGGESAGGIEGANFFLFFDPLPYVHLFSELETGQLVGAAGDQRGARSHLRLGVDRAYGDFGASDALGLRFGKFLTPIGRWNPVPAEPFVWTASEPLIVENVFDDTVTGAMLFGRAFAPRGALSYSLYGTFLDPFDFDPGEPPAEHSAGGYVEWASLDGWALGASYFASEARGGPWHHLGGVDGLWRPSARIELSGEAVFGEGTRENGALWGLYAQAVVETIDTLYAIGRYEHFAPPGDGRAIDLYDVGLTWIPVYYLRLKVDYRIADHRDELSAPGLRSSLSLLF
ncbi:MAG: hypothetical protein HYY35_02500 [Deltaproteobacteria bacterium]|nr:hypothetical protein [Deltaproteobacteria bacterium]